MPVTCDRPPARVELFGMSVPRARLFGAAFGKLTAEVRLVGGRDLDLHTLRTSECVKVNLDMMLSAADAAFLLGVLAHNTHLAPETASAMLRAGLARTSVIGSTSVRDHGEAAIEARALLAQAVQEVTGDMPRWPDLPQITDP